MEKRKLTGYIYGGMLLGMSLFTACGKEPENEVGATPVPTSAEAPVVTELPVAEEPSVTPTLTPTAAPTAMLTPQATPGIAQEELTDEQAQFAKLLTQYTEDELMWIRCKDYDQDGIKEAFAITGKVARSPFVGDGEVSEADDCYLGDAWFLSGDSVQCLLEDEYLELPWHITLQDGDILQKIEVLYEMNTQSCLYQVSGGEAVNLLPENVARFQVADDPFSNYGNWFAGYQQACDYYSDGTGFTESPHYFTYQSGRLVEFAGIPVTEEQLCRWESAERMLGEIRAAGGVIQSIYFYCVTDGTSYAVNYQLPVEGEADLWMNCHLLARTSDENAEMGDMAPIWESSDLEHASKIYSMAECQRAGTYQRVLCPEYAEYPTWIPDTEGVYLWDYYTEGKPVSAVFKITTPDGTIVLNAGDIAAISERNLIFTLTEEFKEEARVRCEELGANAGSSEVHRMLGLSKKVTTLQLWMDGGCLLEAPILDYMSDSNWGIATQGKLAGDLPTTNYEGKLVWMLKENELAAEDKIHAFARAKNKLDETDQITNPEVNAIHLTEQEYRLDLNGDGTEESLFIGGRKLLINEVEYFALMEDVWNDWMEQRYFYLCDLDESDGIVEIILLAHGPSSDEWCKVLWYDGSSLKVAGQLPGSVFFASEEKCWDGAGNVELVCGLNLLQTWYGKKAFQLTTEHTIEFVEQEEYAVWHQSGEIPEYQLLQAIRLYEKKDALGAYQVLEPQKIKLLATDEKNFVLLEAEDGTRGYIYVEWYDSIQLEDGSMSEGSYNVIEGLHHAG